MCARLKKPFWNKKKEKMFTTNALELMSFQQHLHSFGNIEEEKNELQSTWWYFNGKQLFTFNFSFLLISFFFFFAAFLYLLFIVQCLCILNYLCSAYWSTSSACNSIEKVHNWCNLFMNKNQMKIIINVGPIVKIVFFIVTLDHDLNDLIICSTTDYVKWPFSAGKFARRCKIIFFSHFLSLLFISRHAIESVPKNGTTTIFRWNSIFDVCATDNSTT